MLTELEYRSLPTSDIQPNLPHLRKTSEPTLLNAGETNCQDSLQQETSQQTDIPAKRTASGVSSEVANGDAAWDFITEMMETRHNNDVADLKEDHALEVAECRYEIECLQRELESANKKAKKTQERVEELLRGHVDLKAQADTCQEALQQVKSTSQVLQTQYDELKEKHEESLACDNTPLPPPTQPGDQNTGAECPLHDHKFLEQDLVQSQRACQAMAVDLNEAHEENRLRSNEVYELRRALELHPEHDIGLQKVIEYKNHMLQELEAKAGRCFSDLTNSQKKHAEDKDLAYEQITSLKAQLAKKTSAILQLWSLRKEYKEVSEGILAMLQKKIHANEFVQAMQSYFQVATSENQILSAGIKSKEEQVDKMNREISRLRADLLQAKRSSDEKDGICKDLQQNMREKKAEIGNLQMEYDMLQHDSEQVIQERDRSLAEAEKRTEVVSNELERVQAGTVGEAARGYILRQKEEKDHFRALHQQACEENYGLERVAAERDGQAKLQTCLIYYNGVREETVEGRLKVAEKEVEALREENRRLANLPDLIHISKVLRVQEEFEAARTEIQRLTRVVREQDWRNGNDAYQTAVKCILQLKKAGYDHLSVITQFNKANQVGEFPDFDLNKMDRYIEECQEFLEAVPSCDPDEEDMEEPWMPPPRKPTPEPEETEEEAAKRRAELNCSFI